MRGRAARFMLLGAIWSCSSPDDGPKPIDASMSDASIDVDGQVDFDVRVMNDTSHDGGGGAHADVEVDARAEPDGGLDVDDVRIDVKDSAPSGDGSRQDGGSPPIDAAPWDGGFANCFVLPPLPPTTRAEGRLWFSLPQVLRADRTRERGNVIYGAANPPFRLDAATSSLCVYPAPMTGEQTADILAPASTSTVVIVYGNGSGPRVIRTSADDGRTWSTARAPGVPMAVSASLPCELTALPSTSGPPARLFATYGGTTLDVSENGGLDWTRVIEGGGVASAGFAVDSAGETLWYIGEGVPDRIAAWSIPISPSGPLPSTWNGKVLPDWDSNHVWIAVADPFDPHAMYLGGDGRLGYLKTADAGVIIDLPWSLPRLPPNDLFIFVRGLWVDPSQNRHVIWGGWNGMRSARLLESTEGGQNAQEIPLEGPPAGSVAGVHHLPALGKLVVLLQSADDATLAVYVLDR